MRRTALIVTAALASVLTLTTTVANAATNPGHTVSRATFARSLTTALTQAQPAPTQAVITAIQYSADQWKTNAHIDTTRMTTLNPDGSYDSTSNTSGVTRCTTPTTCYRATRTDTGSQWQPVPADTLTPPRTWLTTQDILKGVPAHATYTITGAKYTVTYRTKNRDFEIAVDVDRKSASVDYYRHDTRNDKQTRRTISLTQQGSFPTPVTDPTTVPTPTP